MARKLLVSARLQFKKSGAEDRGEMVKSAR